MFEILTPELLADLVTTALEGGSNYWLTCAQSVSSTARCTQPWYADPAFYTQHFEMHFDTQDDNALVFNQSALNRGWDLLKVLYPNTQARITENDGQWDADDFDILLQLSLFGDIIYG